MWEVFNPSLAMLYPQFMCSPETLETTASVRKYFQEYFWRLLRLFHLTDADILLSTSDSSAVIVL